MYYTLQGEGAQAGRPAVFLRFAGCNLWSGREQDRQQAVCKFCDTEFIGTGGPGGGKFPDARALAASVAEHWPRDVAGDKWVVCTGGEPLLQLDEDAVKALHDRGFSVAVETNGTVLAPGGLDWICVSPKAAAPLLQTTGNELKLVFPQPEAEAQPECFVDLAFSRFYLQPKDDAHARDNLQAAIRYCLDHPRWHLSLQTHKLVGLP